MSGACGGAASRVLLAGDAAEAASTERVSACLAFWWPWIILRGRISDMGLLSGSVGGDRRSNLIKNCCPVRNELVS